MFDRIEPEAKVYLKKVMLTLSAGLLWMFINVLAGLGYECALIEGRFTTTNFIFYAWMSVSLVFLILFFVKMWRHK